MKSWHIICVASLAVTLQGQVPARVHTVQTIFVDGRPVDSAAVTVTRNGHSDRILRRGATLFDGTRVDVPAHVTVIVVSTGNKSTATLQPGSSVTFVSTANGELVSSLRGRSIFNVVPKALDFFRVQSGEVLTASVHGTEFSVENDRNVVTFACKQGEVNITKTGYLLIGQRRLQTSLIDVISSARTAQVTYHPSSDWTLARFTTFAQAEAFYRGQLTDAQRSGDANAVNAARLNLGNVQRLQGRYADAIGTYSQALAFYRQEVDRDRQADALVGIGVTYLDQSRYAQSIQTLNEALVLFRQVGDSRGEAQALRNIGIVQMNLRKYAESLDAHRQSLAINRATGDIDGEARTLLDIGVVQYTQGQYSAALTSVKASLPLFQRASDRDGEAAALANIGIVYLYQKRYDEASVPLQQAYVMLRDLGDRSSAAYTLMNMGIVASRQGRYRQALGDLQQSIGTFRAIGDRMGMGSALQELAAAQERQGHYQEALASLRQAGAAFHQIPAPADEATVNASIARIERRLHGVSTPP